MTKEERKAKRQERKAKKVSFWTDFKQFITKGNVVDMAVAVVIATAFNAIVNGLVKFIITPAISYFTSNSSIDEWEYVLKEAVIVNGVEETAKVSIQYGLWIQTILDFLIIAFCIFVALRIIKRAERRIHAHEIEQAEAAAAAQKAIDDAKAAEAQVAADAEKAALDEFYANVKEQSALLREISQSLKK